MLLSFSEPGSIHTSQGQSRIQAFLKVNVFVFSFLKMISEAFFKQIIVKSLGNVFKPIIYK